MGNLEYTVVVFGSMNSNTLEITLSKYCNHTTGSRQSWVGRVAGVLCHVLS